MVELVKGISKLPDRRLEADRPRHSIQFINDTIFSTWTLSASTAEPLPLSTFVRPIRQLLIHTGLPLSPGTKRHSDMGWRLTSRANCPVTSSVA
ncbi:hypothetical protein TNCV_2674991 [Trichonephila clavipes]|nr:hypothetical protein TNCV_2674991 [Trichonephila clavipes]